MLLHFFLLIIAKQNYYINHSKYLIQIFDDSQKDVKKITDFYSYDIMILLTLEISLCSVTLVCLTSKTNEKRN